MKHEEQKVRVRPVRRVDPDLRKLARAFVDLALVEKTAEQSDGEEVS